MAGESATEGARVSAAAEGVLRFWLQETPEDKRFARNDGLDAEIASRFADLRARVLATHAAGWRAEPRTVLAAVILLDQFSRNMHHDDARAYAADPLARALARHAVVRGWDAGMTADERRFLHMPFMHSERMDDQLASLALYGPEDAWAPPHAAQVARFGRFPRRNAALGRESTPDEAVFLAQPGDGF